ncbi:IclR family transcriptional regulator [Paenibacillus cellulosilyticus]|uniref:IclR family transcriptional regulator n=1 Tax=Paenibacillus cellulosilyticus TaxID=375489 RepID=A0A2V2YYS4_9BACL|nr:IclR family transcriptional regulator [Paenibacillus cellulosilyticus]PWW07514.1 IclR family transcriptional regulator [Paenibacillus cellulosilyticus]QKS44332.1 IclR family transcriptional regulator [Paenibacillus cellulosilyticus]
MTDKYQVPAVRRANDVMLLVAAEPARLRLIDLARRLDVNKSSMFSLLYTLESLRWIEKNEDDTYSLGSTAGAIGNAFFRQFDFVAAFHREARTAAASVGATFQLARLEGREVIYLAMEEAKTPLRLASSPGARLPAHVTALGKALLSKLDEQTLNELYPEQTIGEQSTPYSITDRDTFFQQLALFRQTGIAEEMQEGVVGICCAAAPVFRPDGHAVAAISCSISVFEWESRRDAIREAVAVTASRISGLG